jgi:hypothetical protein
MPQCDIYHEHVKTALIKDGWTITHDPYRVALGIRDAFVDLGAEQTIAADRGGQRIAVEVKSFLGRSVIADLAQAIGQYTIYRSWMRRVDPGRELWLAVSERVAQEVFADLSGEVLIIDSALHLIVVNVDEERIVRWIS